MSEQILVSVVTSATEIATRDYNASKVIETIRTGGKKLREQVERLRGQLASELATHGDAKRAKQAASELKKQLPGVLWSGTFTKRSNDALIQHSGVLCADLDSLNGSLSDVRGKLSKSPHVWALFQSPSGDGLKAVFRVPAAAAKHAGSFRAIEQHVRELTGVQIDQACKDVARLCFLSYDPDVFYNANAIEIEPLPEPVRPKPACINGEVLADMPLRERIASELLGQLAWSAEKSGFFCRCPGEESHTNGTAEKHTILYLHTSPTIKCQHSSCGKVVEAFNTQLRSLVGKAERPQQSKTAAASAETKKEEKALQGSAVLCPDVEAWPESINGAELLNEVSAAIRRYVVLSESEADAVALWCAHTHCFDLCQHSPRLNITSPERGCGKSTLRDVSALLVNRPLCLESTTTAVTFRLIDKHRPTLLADETDTWLPDNEELRGVLNAGYSRKGLFARCEGDGNEVRTFKVFAPACLCGIGNLPGTLHDRSIVIKLKKRKSNEQVAPFNSDRADKEKNLARKLARFCLDNREGLAACDPKLPDGIFNRLADNWRPLFALADVAGGGWPEKCAVSARLLTDQSATDAETQKVVLLSDIREVVQKLKPDDWIESTELVGALLNNPENAWGDANRGKPINARWVSVRLKGFGINPSRLPRERDGEQHRGYNVSAFRDAFERYLAPMVGTSVQVSQAAVLRGETAETLSETDAKNISVSTVHEGKAVSETDGHLNPGGGLIDEAKEIFKGTEVTK